MRRTRRSRTVHYSRLNPISDRLTEYKGRIYLTKEDLKKFPTKVTLIPLKKHHHKKQSHYAKHHKLNVPVTEGGYNIENTEGNY